jgi:hypothetical protein
MANALDQPETPKDAPAFSSVISFPKEAVRAAIAAFSAVANTAEAYLPKFQDSDFGFAPGKPPGDQPGIAPDHPQPATPPESAHGMTPNTPPEAQGQMPNAQPEAQGKTPSTPPEAHGKMPDTPPPPASAQGKTPEKTQQPPAPFGKGHQGSQTTAPHN